MARNLRLIGALVLMAGATGGKALWAQEPAKDAVFKMEEVSAFDVKELGVSGGLLGGGPMLSCSPTPNPQVKSYPKLKSKHRSTGR